MKLKLKVKESSFVFSEMWDCGEHLSMDELLNNMDIIQRPGPKKDQIKKILCTK